MVAYHAKFSIKEVGSVIVLFDQGEDGPYQSITNDAGNVVQMLQTKGYDVDFRPIIYRDTNGYFDQILVKEGLFAGFAPIRKRDEDEAVCEAFLRTAKVVRS